MKKITLSFGFAITLLVIILLTGCSAVEPGLNLAEVEEIEILIMESFPVQISVIARGFLPDPCTKISEVSQGREGNTFFVTVKTYRPQGFCIQVLAPFKETIPLDVYGLSAGTYTVNVNGVEDTFTLDIDNIPQTI